MQIVYIEGEMSLFLTLKIVPRRSKTIDVTYCTLVMTRIPVPYNDVYRWLFKIRRRVSISAIFVSKGVDGFNVLRRKLICSFVKRIHTSENPLIQAIFQRGKFEDSAVNRERTKALCKI